MIIPGQVLEKAEKLNAENVTFIQQKDGYDVFRLSFKQLNLRSRTEWLRQPNTPITVTGWHSKRCQKSLESDIGRNLLQSQIHQILVVTVAAL